MRAVYNDVIVACTCRRLVLPSNICWFGLFHIPPAFIHAFSVVISGILQVPEVKGTVNSHSALYFKYNHNRKALASFILFPSKTIIPTTENTIVIIPFTTFIIVLLGLFLLLFLLM